VRLRSWDNKVIHDERTGLADERSDNADIPSNQDDFPSKMSLNSSASALVSVIYDGDRHPLKPSDVFKTRNQCGAITEKTARAEPAIR
jgi:hypothetical protein